MTLFLLVKRGEKILVFQILYLPKIPFSFVELFVAVFHTKFKTALERGSAKFELTFYRTNGSALFTLPEMHHQCVPSPRHFERCIILLAAL